MLTQHALLQWVWSYDYELLPAICYTDSVNYLHPMLYHGEYGLRHTCILCLLGASSNCFYQEWTRCWQCQCMLLYSDLIYLRP